MVKALPEIKDYKVGLLNLFIQHTSCALSLNENWDEDVRADMSDALERIVPEDKGGKGLYRHDAEGRDDMPVCAVFCVGCVSKALREGVWAIGDVGGWAMGMREGRRCEEDHTRLEEKDEVGEGVY